MWAVINEFDIIIPKSTTPNYINEVTIGLPLHIRTSSSFILCWHVFICSSPFSGFISNICFRQSGKTCQMFLVSWTGCYFRHTCILDFNCFIPEHSKKDKVENRLIWIEKRKKKCPIVYNWGSTYLSSLRMLWNYRCGIYILQRNTILPIWGISGDKTTGEVF